MAQTLANYRKVFAKLRIDNQTFKPALALIAEDASSNLPSNAQVFYTEIGGQISWKRCDLVETRLDGAMYLIDSSLAEPLHLLEADEAFYEQQRDAGFESQLRRTRPSITDENSLGLVFENGLQNSLMRDYPDVALAPNATHIEAQSNSTLPGRASSYRPRRPSASGAARRARKTLNIDVWSKIS